MHIQTNKERHKTTSINTKADSGFSFSQSQFCTQTNIQIIHRKQQIQSYASFSSIFQFVNKSSVSLYFLFIPNAKYLCINVFNLNRNVLCLYNPKVTTCGNCCLISKLIKDFWKEISLFKDNLYFSEAIIQKIYLNLKKNKLNAINYSRSNTNFKHGSQSMVKE